MPGFSQVEVKGKNHGFLAGDKSHPENAGHLSADLGYASTCNAKC